MTTLLSTQSLTAFYGDFQALFAVDFSIKSGEAVAIIGANGAGKSTFLKSLVGQITKRDGQITFKDSRIEKSPAPDIARLGLAMVPEGRRLFQSLSVEENLMIGAEVKRKGPWNLERIYGLFPILKEKRHNGGTELSGGQQQMVAIGRALMANPSLLLCDEISLGLAPVIIKDIYESLPDIRKEGTALVIVEQDIHRALKAAERIYCFQEGRVSLEGSPDDLTLEAITQAYFGV